MIIENIDFEDLPEEEVAQENKLVNVTIKVPEETRKMFQKISARERRNMASYGCIIIEEFINKYVKEYQAEQANKK